MSWGPSQEFFFMHANLSDFRAKSVLEIGSRWESGGIRPVIERYLNPARYIGIDLLPGKYVDVVLPSEELTRKFNRDDFDVVIAIEVLEHVRDWNLSVNQILTVLKPGGVAILTTRSRGFGYHGYPNDYWRFELEDFRRMFSTFTGVTLESDWAAPGIFFMGRKPRGLQLSEVKPFPVYSMVLGKKTDVVPEISEAPVVRRLVLRVLQKEFAPEIVDRLVRGGLSSLLH